MTLKTADNAPDDIVTLAGAAATLEFEVEITTGVPPAGAGLLRVTVALAGLPPMTVFGARLRAERPTLQGNGAPAPSNS